jgi:hypothetical protein
MIEVLVQILVTCGVMAVTATPVALFIIFVGWAFIQTYKKTGIIATFIVFSLASVYLNPLTKESPIGTFSSSSSSSSSKIITEQQLHQIVKGCCSGVGGTYRSSYDEGCVVDLEQNKPFRDCVGKGKVKYSNGQVGNYYGSKFTR